MSMNFSARLVIVSVIAWLALLSVGGCTRAHNASSPSPQTPTAAQVSIVAPVAVTIDANGETVLEVTVRLHNSSAQPLQLFAGTPCAVFRWAVASADKIVQREPNRLCAQVVAAAVLPAHESIEQQHKITLDNARYRSGDEYLLRYQFWRHDGVHAFTLTD